MTITLQPSAAPGWVEHVRELTELLGRELRPRADEALTGPQALIDMAGELAEWADRIAAHHAEAQCGAGCAFCCYERVVVTAPEVFRLVVYLREHWPPEQVADLRKRLGKVAARIKDMDGADYYRARVACPMLGDDNRCTVYAARPVACRNRNSRSRASCRQAWQRRDPDHPTPVDPLQLFGGQAPSNVFDEICVERGLAGGQYELVAALRIALDVPDAIERWLAGEDVLAKARDRHVGGASERHYAALLARQIGAPRSAPPRLDVATPKED